MSERLNVPRSWHRFRLTVPADTGDDFSDLCFELGRCGVQYEEQPSQWLFTVYFDSEMPVAALRSDLALFLERRGGDGSRLVADTEEERDWSTAWRDFIEPVEATGRIRIRPPWIPAEPSRGLIEIVIEPKMAFGTGGHESTRLCLLALEDADPAGASCLDLGTGSGVLAIAATLLGARRVTAIDCDRIACDNARENVRLNLGARPHGLDARVEVLDGSVEAVEGREYDVVLANIESQHLRPMLAPVERLLSPGGVALFSGLMSRESERFSQWLEEAGLQAMSERELNGWVCITAVRAACPPS